MISPDSYLQRHTLLRIEVKVKLAELIRLSNAEKPGLEGFRTWPTSVTRCESVCGSSERSAIRPSDW